MRKVNMIIPGMLLLLTGCLGHKPFQPNPYEYERWSRRGEDELGVRKAMLECGYPSPNGVRDRMVDMSATPDDIVLMYRCMGESGFLYDGKKFDAVGITWTQHRALQVPRRPNAMR
jgi:hypothetical protein